MGPTSTAAEVQASQMDGFLCVICLRQSVEPRLLECGHVFCAPCLKAWFRLQEPGKDSCPTCRRPGIFHVFCTVIQPDRRNRSEEIQLVKGYNRIQLASASGSCGRCGQLEARLPVALAGCGHVYCSPCITSLLPTPSPRLQRCLQLPESTSNRKLGLGAPLDPLSLLAGPHPAGQRRGPDLVSIALSRLSKLLNSCTAAGQLDQILFSLPVSYLSFLGEDSPALPRLQTAVAAECKARKLNNLLQDIDKMTVHCPQCTQPFNQTYVFPIYGSCNGPNGKGDEPASDGAASTTAVVEADQQLPPRVLPGSSLLQILSFLEDLWSNSLQHNGLSF
ncbi:hypothetical protein L7F22_042429 [Adiantum nelumboides]|nr:hypothetical protein [Adiantum nelumboides]